MINESPLKMTVCGSFGFGNSGDEAIPLAIRDMACHMNLKIQPSIVGRFNKPQIQNVIGMGSHEKKLRDELRGQPLIMSGGGIIDANPHATIFKCKELITRSFSPRATLLGISVESGVRYGWARKWQLGRILKRFDVVYTRDILSEITLKGILPRVRVETVGDLVLWLKPEAAELPANIKLPKNYIAVTLTPRWRNEESWRNWIANELRILHREIKLPIVFVPMSSEFDDDRDEHRAVAEILETFSPSIDYFLINAPLSPKAISFLFGAAILTISMRLHGCVMAYAQKTPFVALAYHPKLTGFCNTVDMGHSLLPKIPPEIQSENTYGYRFSDLTLPQGELLRIAIDSLSRRNYSRLTELREVSRIALTNFIEDFKHGR